MGLAILIVGAVQVANYLGESPVRVDPGFLLGVAEAIVGPVLIVVAVIVALRR